MTDIYRVSNYTPCQIGLVKGDKGIRGDDGLDGLNGLNGVNGINGKDAYQLAVDAGFIGTISDYRLSLKGDKGDKGDAGVSGTGVTALVEEAVGNVVADATNAVNAAIEGVAIDANLVTDALIATTGGVSQLAINKGLESIASLSSLFLKYNGMRVYVKSYHAGLGIGGGDFVYDSTKSAINDGGLIINGWVRVCDTKRINVHWFGAVGAGQVGDQLAISKAYERLNALGGGTLYIPNGTYLIHYVNYVKEAETGPSLNEQYAFPIYSNITVLGESREHAIFKMADGIIYLDLQQANMGCGLFADAHKKINVVNFKITNFKVDMNGSNNLLVELPTLGSAGAQRALFPVLYYFDYYSSDGIVMDNVWVHENSGYNSVFVGHKSSNTEIKNCKFTDHADYIDGNVELKDHSTIYIAGLNGRVVNNEFLMTRDARPLNPTTKTSTISCAVETHGVNTLVSGNTIVGYGCPFLAACTEWYSSENMLITDNMVYEAGIGFAFNSMNGRLSVTLANNKIHLRKAKASFDENGVRFVHAAVESTGAINSVYDYANAYSEVYIINNTFEQAQPDDWNGSDNYINSCFAVKETKLFVAKGNTFKNFKGCALNVLAHRNWLESEIILSDNTYINCGTDNSYNVYGGAYQLSDGVFAAEKGYDFNLLKSITITNDTFINCIYGVLLTKYNDLTAKNIDITGVNYQGQFIPAMQVVKPIAFEHNVNIEYNTNGKVLAGQTLGSVSGMSGHVKLKNWSSAIDYNGRQTIEYIKTAFNPWNLRATSSYTPTTGGIAPFAFKDGDRVDVLSPGPDGFGSFIYSNNQWYGLDKLVAANIFT